MLNAHILMQLEYLHKYFEKRPHILVISEEPSPFATSPGGIIRSDFLDKSSVGQDKIVSPNCLLTY